MYTVSDYPTSPHRTRSRTQIMTSRLAGRSQFPLLSTYNEIFSTFNLTQFDCRCWMLSCLTFVYYDHSLNIFVRCLPTLCQSSFVEPVTCVILNRYRLKTAWILTSRSHGSRALYIKINVLFASLLKTVIFWYHWSHLWTIINCNVHTT